VQGARPRFYFDVASPWCWVAGERVNHELGVVPEWVPVLARAPVEVDRAAVERAAARAELPELRWPDPFPFDSEMALLAATYAKKIGKVAAFSLAAFRQAYAGGRALDEETVLIAGAAAEIHPAALLKGITLRSVREALE